MSSIAGIDATMNAGMEVIGCSIEIGSIKIAKTQISTMPNFYHGIFIGAAPLIDDKKIFMFEFNRSNGRFYTSVVVGRGLQSYAGSHALTNAMLKTDTPSFIQTTKLLTQMIFIA